MLDSISIMRLYACVLHEDIITYRIPEANIRSGIQNMGFVYKPDATRLNDVESVSSNFNIPAFRCAYLHKYAPLHTFIVIDVMLRILREKMALFQNFFFKSGQFKLCCLGGGPGSDAIGILAVFYSTFPPFKSTVTLVDSMSNWELTFTTLIRELAFGEYGSSWMNLKRGNLEWNYVEANLLSTMTDEVNKSIGSASFISMVKFISAAICKDTESMVEKIFRVMKPGAFVLYIDNAAGGFTQIIERAAKKNNLIIIVGPLRHLEYENESLKIDRFGYTSCYQTKVTAILLQKAHSHNQSRKQGRTVPKRSKQTVSVPEAMPYVIPSAEACFGKYAFDKPDSLPSNRNATSSVQTDGKIDKTLYPSNRNAKSSGQNKGIINNTPHSNNRNAIPGTSNIKKSVGKENRKELSGSSNFDQRKSPMKQNNLDKELQNSYSRAKKNFSATPYSVVESQPFVSVPSARDSSAEPEPETVDACCSCCVIS